MAKPISNAKFFVSADILKAAIDQLEQAKNLLQRCYPYIKERADENFEDFTLGLFMDSELETLSNEVEGFLKTQHSSLN